ncbi:hypothetical protein NIES4071_07640 [Calothrix sp. NIES-4071]|nr:hypothetical protein NIES4071_07640 [Calothrix sp. NIES-4071]BAZ55106.1 hypothetical protein NIES4105_07600 [Calothrix sp. NIES-4105]
MTLHDLVTLPDLPSTFTKVVTQIETFVLLEFDSQIAQNQLYYHNRAHINSVRRRANDISNTVLQYCNIDDITRMRLLLDLCAIAHDMIQVFVPQTDIHTTRRRESGVSESLTFEKLSNYIKNLNQQLKEHGLEDAVFSDADISIIKNAIDATVCHYDPSDQSIYQPAIYENKDLSLVALIIALADINSLGMEGIDIYNQEGSLLFLEENPDVISLIKNQSIKNLAVDNRSLAENIRQRLVKRARFQVNFAKSRLMRFRNEIARFPSEAIPVLVNETFRYLNAETVQEVESSTPTDEDTSLEDLMAFFQLDKYAAV